MQLQQMAASFAQQGVAMEQYLQMTGKTMDSLKDELKPVAQKQAKLEAVLDEIIRVENITVSDEEMYQRLKRVDLFKRLVLDCYDVMHTQSLKHVSEDLVEALSNWEKQNKFNR